METPTLTAVRARPRPAPVTVTPAAAQRIADIIAKAPEPAAGVRLTTPKRGCSGLAYDLQYVDAPKPGDEAVETDGGTLFIDGGSLMYLIGSVMDWREDDFSAAFVFENPNAKGACGCGESFTV
jgi:iron-sulfur cluster assembly protein